MCVVGDQEFYGHFRIKAPDGLVVKITAGIKYHLV